MSDVFCYYAIFTKIIRSVFEKWNADFNNDKLKTLCNFDIKIKKFSEKNVINRFNYGILKFLSFKSCHR